MGHGGPRKIYRLAIQQIPAELLPSSRGNLGRFCYQHPHILAHHCENPPVFPQILADAQIKCSEFFGINHVNVSTDAYREASAWGVEMNRMRGLDPRHAHRNGSA